MEGKEINISMRAYEILTESPKNLDAIKKNKVALTDEERKKVMDAGAIWHHGPNGEPSPAVWKGTDGKGKMWYVCNTHRCFAAEDTLAKAIKKYDRIETTA